MLARFLQRVLPVAVAVAFAIAPSTAGAASAPGPAAAAVPGWRIVKFLPSVAMGGFSVSSARDAWLAGDVCGADSLCDHVIVRHWDGTAWRVVTPPRAVTATAGEAGITVTASSASNAWIFDLRGTQSVDYTTAVHWTGRGWAPPTRLAADIDAAVALSARDAWAFGAPAGDSQGGYAAHFNGRTWSHALFPVQVQAASALSAGDLWVGGAASDVTGPSVIIEHWNGQAWRATPVPSLGIPPGSWTSVSVTAVTPRDVWAEVFTQGDGTQGSYLLHWGGRAWARVAFACPGTAASAVAPDGHGGVWLVSSTAPASSGTSWFCHDSSGHWTKAAVPRRAGEQPGIDSLAWIPGTRSLWATGGFDADAGEAILKYGP